MAASMLAKTDASVAARNGTPAVPAALRAPRASRRSACATRPVAAAATGAGNGVEAKLASQNIHSLLRDEQILHSYLSGRVHQVSKHFPNSLGCDDFINRVETALYAFGFHGDNTISVTNLCRDEITAVLKEKLDAVFGSSFNINGLGGVLTCGVTGVKAGLSHAPVPRSGKERYVFFSFPHIGIDATGAVGNISRPGRAGKSTACGALAASLGELHTKGLKPLCGCPGEHDWTDPEYSILKQRLARRIRFEGKGEADVKKLDLVEMTKIAERSITDDLEYLISKGVDASKADYAVITGVQIHNYSATDYEDNSPNLEFVYPASFYVVVDGVRTDLDINNVPSMTPRQLSLVTAAAGALNPAANDHPAAIVDSAGNSTTIQGIDGPYRYASADRLRQLHKQEEGITSLLWQQQQRDIKPTREFPAWQQSLLASAPFKRAEDNSVQLDEAAQKKHFSGPSP